jgi:hypothetical protein
MPSSRLTTVEFAGVAPGGGRRLSLGPVLQRAPVALDVVMRATVTLPGIGIRQVFTPYTRVPGGEEMGAALDRTAALSLQLLDTMANVTRIVGNTIGPSADPAAMLTALQRTTAELARASSSAELPAALTSLVDTAVRLGPRAAPLVEALEPLLERTSPAVTELAEAAGPLLPVLAKAVAGLLALLLPVVEAWSEVLRACEPEVERLTAALTEIGTALAPVAGPGLAAVPTRVARSVLAPTAEVAEAVAPSVTELAEAASALGAAVRDLVAAAEQRIGQLTGTGLGSAEGPMTARAAAEKVAPAVRWVSGRVADGVHGRVVPAVDGFTAWLRGVGAGAGMGTAPVQVAAPGGTG